MADVRDHVADLRQLLSDAAVIQRRESGFGRGTSRFCPRTIGQDRCHVLGGLLAGPVFLRAAGRSVRLADLLMRMYWNSILTRFQSCTSRRWAIPILRKRRIDALGNLPFLWCTPDLGAHQRNECRRKAIIGLRLFLRRPRERRRFFGFFGTVFRFFATNRILLEGVGRTRRRNLMFGIGPIQIAFRV